MTGRLKRDALAECLRWAANTAVEAGAVIAKIDPLGADGMGPRKLARRIHKRHVTHFFGYYCQLGVFASESMLRTIEREYKLDDRMLRTMTVKMNTMDFLKEPVEMDRSLPEMEVSAEDPLMELKNFMLDYQKEHPSGESIDISARLRRNPDINLQPVLRNITSTSGEKPPEITSKYLEMLDLQLTPDAKDDKTGTESKPEDKSKTEKKDEVVDDREDKDK